MRVAQEFAPLLTHPHPARAIAHSSSSSEILFLQRYSDSVLGLAWMMEAIVILGSFRKATRDTANKAADTTCSAIRTEKENPMGWTGLKTHAATRKAAAHAYLRKFTACTRTNTAAAVITKSK
jgi:hypothetical protein